MSPLVTLIIAWWVFWFYMILRLREVSDYRHWLFGQIALANLSDIQNGFGYSSWRWELYVEVSMDEMMYKFWRDVRSFYTDLSFLEPKKRPV